MDQDLPGRCTATLRPGCIARDVTDARCSVLFQDSGIYHTLTADARQGITWVTYKQEYLRGSASIPLSLCLARAFSPSVPWWWSVCTLVAIGEKEREREIAIAREKLYALDSQVSGLSRRVRIASPRYASLEPRCHRGSIYRVRQSTKADLSSSLGLPTYLPTYPPIWSAAPRQRAGSPLLSSALFPRERVTRDARSITAEIASRYALRCYGVCSQSHLLPPIF